jgi:Na+-transporting NADH:ubiquinone oxidoreductase subunit NqrB
MFNIWTRGCNWVQWNPAQLPFLLHLSSLPSSQPNVIPRLQPTFTRTSGHCLGTFIAVNLSLFPALLNVMSHTTHQLSLHSRYQTVKKINHDIFWKINAYSYLPQKEGHVEIFEVLTAVKLLVVCRIVTPCRFVGSFVGTFRVHPQCWNWNGYLHTLLPGNFM